MTRRLTILALIFLAGCDMFSESEDLRTVGYVGPPIVPVESRMAWTASVEGPTVTLRGNPDEGELIYLVTLKDRPGKLPLLTDIWYGNPSHLGNKIRSATFEVEEWNPDGVISGVLRLVQPSGGKVQMEIWTRSL